MFQPQLGARLGARALLLAALLAVSCVALMKMRAPSAQMEPVASAVAKPPSRLPLFFESNQGQFHPDVRFVSRMAGGNVAFTPEGAVFSFGTSKKRFEMRLVGAQGSEPRGAEPLEGKTNYFIGSDRSAWRTGVPTYAQVEYPRVYPGVDLVFYGNAGHIEYDFLVAPGANPDAVLLELAGLDDISVDTDGNLQLRAGSERAAFLRPHVYQRVGEEKRELLASYVVREDHRVAFKLSGYDAAHPLVIDPIFVYSSYLGGSAEDNAYGIAVDSSGSVYLAGRTSSVNFPVVNALQGTKSTGFDGFITKLNAAGSAIVYSTFIGGNGAEAFNDIKVDAAGNAYVTGQSSSTNYPVTAGAFQTTYGGGASDAVVTKLDAAGASLVLSSYVGGSGLDEGARLALDASGNIHVTGRTSSSADYPVRGSVLFQSSYGGGASDAIVFRMNAAGSALTFSAFLGGSGEDFGLGMGLDDVGSVYVTGATASANFPVAGITPFQSTYGGGAYDGYVAKISSTGAVFFFSSFLGGAGSDIPARLAVDGSRRPYVVGSTTGSFPTASAVQGTYGGGLRDGFVARVNNTGTGLEYATYVGGTAEDQAYGISIDAQGTAYIAGITASAGSFPLSDAPQPSYGGGAFDGFVAQLNASGSVWLYSTFIGGAGDDRPQAVAVDAFGNALVTGFTASGNFPTAAALQTANAGGAYDAFFAQVGVLGPTLGGVSPGSGRASGGTQVSLTGANFVSGATVTFDGVPATSVTFVGATSLLATSPAHAAGAVEVRVTHPNGQSSALANAFTYVPPPTLTAVTPAFGPEDAQTQVTLTGADFISGATVRVAGALATDVIFVDANTLRATVPAQPAQLADVSVENPDGQSDITPGAFTYVAPSDPRYWDSASNPTIDQLNQLKLACGCSGSTGGASSVAGMAVLLLVLRMVGARE
jgi:hypothetical protein